MASKDSLTAIKMLSLLYCHRNNTSSHHLFNHLDLQTLAEAHIPALILQWLIPPETLISNRKILSYQLPIDIGRKDDTPVQKDTPYFNEEFLYFAEHQLQNSHTIITQIEPKHHDTSIERPAIEICEYNYRPNPINSICIEVLRDYAAQYPEYQDECIHRWWQSKVPLLQRIALHTITISKWSSDKKLTWILNQKLLGNTEYHHEVCQLMACSINTASDQTLNQLLTAIQELNPNSNDERHAWHQYILLNWILIHLHNGAHRSDAINWHDKLSKQYSFKPPALPSFWHARPEETSGIMDQSQLLNLLRKTHTSFPRELLLPPNGVPNSPKLYHTIQFQIPIAIAQAPEIGIRLWKLLETAKTFSSQSSIYFEAILKGWLQSNDITNEHKNIIIKLVHSLLIENELTNFHITPPLIVSVIHHLFTHEEENFPKDLIPLCDEIMHTLWQTYAHANFTEAAQANWEDSPVTRSLNTGLGEIAWFWMKRINVDYPQSNSKHSFSSSYQRLLTELVDAKSDIAIFTRPVILDQLNMLHAIDPPFTEKLVGTILNGSNKSDRNLIWNSFSPMNFPNPRLFFNFFFDSFIEEIRNLDDLPDHNLRSFLNFVLVVLCRSDISQDQKNKIYRALTSPQAIKYNVQFMQQTVEWLHKYDDRHRNRIWDTWLRNFIEKKSQQEGGTWSNEERIWFAAAIPLLGRSISQGMQLLGTPFPAFPESESHLKRQIFYADIFFEKMTNEDIAILVDFYSMIISQMSCGEYHLEIGDFLKKAKPFLSAKQITTLRQLTQSKDISIDLV